MRVCWCLILAGVLQIACAKSHVWPVFAMTLSRFCRIRPECVALYGVGESGTMTLDVYDGGSGEHV